MLNISINPRIALSAASIVASGALLVGATLAFFSDTATSTGNILGTGTLNLRLDDNDESTPVATVSASFTASNLAPNASASGFFSLHNTGTINMAKVKFGATQTNNSNGGDGSNIADVLDLNVKTGNDNTCSTGTVDQTPTITAEIGDLSAPLTLSELNGATYDALPGITNGSSYFLCLTGTMRSTAGNQYQGDSITETFNFEGDQDASQ